MPKLSNSAVVAVNVNNFAPGLLEPEIVDIDSLTEDPDNARLHPQRNIEAVMESVRRHGQRSTVIVRRSNRVIAKGNGTLVALKRLGWTRIAASFQDMTEAEFHDYALGDNKSSELGEWDAEVVARLQKLHESTGGCRTGWSDEDLLTLRAAEWEQPLPDGDGKQGWEELWQGMPEFDQQDLTAAVQFKVNCKTEDDAKAFLELIGQGPGDVTQGNSVWFPKAEIGRFADKRYAVGKGDDE